MKKFSKEDIKFMKKAIETATTAVGKASPDPLVGAVIVKNGKIISTGYHERMATPHAETWAISKAGKRAKGATLYVNLEPCCHFGNTPPCTDYIISSGIKKVVAAIEDPNPLVHGKGFKQLKNNGIKVVSGVLAKEARKLNEAFIKYIKTKTPFVILKSAESLDGKIATPKGESRWITSLEARKYVHHIRNTVDAIMVGIGTVKKDDPELSVRLVKKIKNPIRIVIDPKAMTPLSAKVLKTKSARTIIVTLKSANHRRIAKLEKKCVQVLVARSNKGMIDLSSLLVELGKMQITSLLIEGGSEIAASALEQKIVDKIVYCIAPKIIGGRSSPSPVGGSGINKINKAIKLKDLEFKKVGADLLIEAYPQY